MRDRALIRAALAVPGATVSSVARDLRASRVTVRRARDHVGADWYVRSPAGSAVDELEPQIRRLLAEAPLMPVSVLAHRVGWSRSRSVLAARMRLVRGPFEAVQVAPVVRRGAVPRVGNWL